MRLQMRDAKFAEMVYMKCFEHLKMLRKCWMDVFVTINLKMLKIQSNVYFLRYA